MAPLKSGWTNPPPHTAGGFPTKPGPTESKPLNKFKTKGNYKSPNTGKIFALLKLTILYFFVGRKKKKNFSKKFWGQKWYPPKKPPQG